MADPRRLDLPAAPTDRDARVEALLVEGLDHYFNGRLEEAIHVWTRVLFLDRSHARARAYIDRARTALAERQRRSEEMLQASQDLLNRGHTDRARDWLTAAVEAAGDDERAADLRVRIERRERLHTTAAPPRIHPAPGGGRIRLPWRRRQSAAVLGSAAASAVALLLILSLATPGAGVPLGLGVTGASTPATAARTPVPALSGADVALMRARNYYAADRFSEALVALDRVGPESPARAEADRLKVEIQRLLLAAGHERSPGGH